MRKGRAPTVSVQVDGLMVLAGAVVVGGVVLYLNRGKLADALNPANPENVVNQTVTGIVGEERMSTAADHLFGAIDLMNPFNESDAYAVQVYGGNPLLNYLDGPLGLFND